MLYQRSTEVSNSTFERADRHVKLWVKLVTPLIKNFFWDAIRWKHTDADLTENKLKSVRLKEKSSYTRNNDGYHINIFIKRSNDCMMM